MSKYKINIIYGKEDLNNLLIDIILREVKKNYGL